jgi:hypothetical protein
VEFIRKLTGREREPACAMGLPRQSLWYWDPSTEVGCSYQIGDRLPDACTTQSALSSAVVLLHQKTVQRRWWELEEVLMVTGKKKTQVVLAYHNPKGFHGEWGVGFFSSTTRAKERES